MTLCLAWKMGEEVVFASDSRLKNSEITASNSATKIFSIDVRIIGASNNEDKNQSESLLYQSKFGMCFTGSYINGNLLADTISEVLNNVLGSPEISDFSMKNLTDIAFDIYKEISIRQIEIHKKEGASEVLIGGYCPVSCEFQLYRFFPSTFDNIQGFSFCNETIDINLNPYLIGDREAKEKAELLLLREKENKKYTPFHLLRDVINDSTISTVRGNIQAGLFSNQGFKTCDIAEYEEDYNVWGYPCINQKYSYRGHSLGLNDSTL